MINATISGAIAAYKSAAQALTQPGAEPRQSAGTTSFADLLGTAAERAVRTMQDSERVSLAAAVGKVELADVVTAVTNAEVTLQTVVAVRDRVIQAYQDILRMPI